MPRQPHGTLTYSCEMSSTWTVENGKAVWDGRRLADWVPELVDGLVRAFEPIEIWLYGSVARGDDDGDSDIDLLVMLDHYDPAGAIELKTKAIRSVTSAAPFDVCFTDRTRFEQRSSIPGTVERAALLDGRRVHVRG